MRIAEVHLDVSVDLQPHPLGHLPALVPGQGSAGDVGQVTDQPEEAVVDGLGVVTVRELAEKQEPGAALDGGHDRRAVERAHDQIALPMPGDRPVRRADRCPRPPLVAVAPGEVAVNGGAGHTEKVGDPLHGLVTGVAQLLGEGP